MYALLPMKSNSERVPNKNITKINNKPLFFYIADTMLKSKLFKKLVINTDSNKIEKLATKRYGPWVHIIQRPQYLIGDNISMNKIIKYDIKLLGLDNNYFQTHSTNPFLKLSTIKKAVKIYLEVINEKKFDSIFSVNEINTRLYTQTIKPLNHNPSHLKKTQDLKPLYEENSNFYIFSGRSFMQNKHRIGKKPRMYITKDKKIESMDIDDKYDMQLAKIISTNLKLL